MIQIFIPFALLFAQPPQTRVLENPDVQVTIKKQERLEAEPVSKPYEIAIEVVCKDKKKKPTNQKINIPVCDFDPQDKQTTIDQNKVSIAHHTWDAKKSIKDPEGQNHCDPKSKQFHNLKTTDLCK